MDQTDSGTQAEAWLKGALSQPNLKPSERCNAIARSVLKEEIGVFGPYSGTHYSHDENTKNVLLTNGRQDSAFAAAAGAKTVDALDVLAGEMRTLKRLMLLLVFLVVSALLFQNLSILG